MSDTVMGTVWGFRAIVLYSFLRKRLPPLAAA